MSGRRRTESAHDEDVLRQKLRRRWLILLLGFPAGGLVIGAALLIAEEVWLLGVMLVYVSVWGLLMARLRCPRCGQWVLWRPVVPGSLFVGFVSPLLPPRCPRCGLRL